MDLLEFVQKYIKTKVDFDGAYGAQCVDLFRQYCKDVLCVPRTEPVEGAKNLVYDYGKNPIEQSAFALVEDRWCARAGDVAVWGATKTNPYGHVAIVLNAYANGLLGVFEQDGFKQDGAKLARRDNKNLIGLLRPWSEI